MAICAIFNMLQHASTPQPRNPGIAQGIRAIARNCSALQASTTVA